MKTLHNYHQVWRQLGFTPEFFNIVTNKAIDKREGYPLRPGIKWKYVYLRMWTVYYLSTQVIKKNSKFEKSIIFASMLFKPHFDTFFGSRVVKAKHQEIRVNETSLKLSCLLNIQRHIFFVSLWPWARCFALIVSLHLGVCTGTCEGRGWYCVWKSIRRAMAAKGLCTPQGAEKDYRNVIDPMTRSGVHKELRLVLSRVRACYSS